MEFLNKSSKNLINDFGDKYFLLIAVLLIAGFLLCKCLSKSGFSVQEYHPFEKSEGGLMGDNKADGNIGLEPIPRRQGKVPPSLENQLKYMDNPQMMDKGNMQQPSLKIQDGSIVLPFNEIWNPGYIPVDMAFKGAVSPGQTEFGPFGMDKPMKDSVPVLKQDAVMEDRQPSSEASLILVYAPWCGHSKNMLSDYEKVKSEFDGKMINNTKMNIIMYNSDVDKDKVKEYGVKGFPTLFFEQGGDLKPFKPRDYNGIVSELKNLTA